MRKKTNNQIVHDQVCSKQPGFFSVTAQHFLKSNTSVGGARKKYIYSVVTQAVKHHAKIPFIQAVKLRDSVQHG